jgi:hypothetical protein
MANKENKRSAGPDSEQPDSPKDESLPDNINVAGGQEGSGTDFPAHVPKVDNEVNDIDFDALRLPPTGQVVVKENLSIIPIRKPKKTEYFRKRPGKDWEIDLPLYEDDDGETYLVGPVCLGFLNDQGLIKRARIHTLLEFGSGVLLLSPIGLPDADGKYNSYNRSREEAYLKAETKWVRIVANKALGGYRVCEPESKLPEPDWPTPPNTLKEMLSIAFKGRYINELDHPIINRLKGRL